MTQPFAAGWSSEVMHEHGSTFSLKVTAKLDSVQSKYQLIEIYDTETYGKLMVIDGSNMVTTRDNFLYHEMLAHTALFTHPDPRRVLIIGGGDCGTLREVLKHPTVEKVWQIDIDEMVTRMSEKYFPELCESNNDPRANIMFADGIQWIKDCEAGSLDVIIVDCTDPVGPAVGLFAEDFYRDCLRALGSKGLLMQQSESPLYHTNTIIKQMHIDLSNAGAGSSHTVPFPQPIYPTGWWSCTMASQDLDVTSFRIEDSAEKPFRTEYYNAEIHAAALAVPEFMRRALGMGDD